MPLPQGRRLRTLVVVLFLAVSLVFALLAFSSPVKSRSTWCAQNADCTFYCGLQKSQYLFCAYAEAAGNPTSFFPPLRTYQTYAATAEAFAVAAVLLLLFMSKRFVIPRLPKLLLTALALVLSWFNKPLMPRFPRRLLMVLVLLGASVFVFLAIVDATFEISSFSQHFDYLFGFKTIQTRGTSYGVVAFAVWGLTIFALALRKGFVGAMKVFGLPAILFLMGMLLVFDYAVMTKHVTNFITWSAWNVDLISNWFVLITVSFLALWGYVPPRLGRVGVGR